MIHNCIKLHSTKMIYILLIILLHIKRIQLLKPLTLSELVSEDYDKLVPPKVTEGDPVDVTVSLYVIQIRSVEETDMNFKMDFVIRQTWQDHRLNFLEREDRNKIILDSKWHDDIWTPDVWFKNALDTKLQQWIMPNIFFWLEKNKTVCFSGRVTLELSCDMEMHYFPHDTQNCGVSIMALMNPATDLRLNWKQPNAIRVSRLMRLPQFEVSSTTLHLCDTFMYEEVYSCIEASFSLTRRSGYFIINIYIPTVLIVMMSMLTFWIPPEAVPARITLGVTSLLTIITKQYQTSMPNVSYIVALNVWLSSCVGFVFCSLLEYAIVITLVKRENTKVNPMGTSDDDPDEVTVVRNTLKNAWKLKSCKLLEKISSELIDVSARFIFPFAFFLFCIIYSSKYG